MKRLADGTPKPHQLRQVTRCIRGTPNSSGLRRPGQSGDSDAVSSPASRQQRRCAASVSESRPRTALFFPGQGVQRVGMATPWLETFPRTVKPVLEEIDAILGFPLTQLIADGPNSKLSATENAQPAIMATSVMILRVLEHEFGFRPPERVHYTLGHSLGEFAALVAGGYLAFPDALRLVRRRAEVMAACTRDASQEGGGAEYGMVALVCEPNRLGSLIEAIHEFLGHASTGSKQDSAEEVPPIQRVLIANINAKNQIVLSGSIERIKTLLTHLRQFGGHDPRAVRLNTDSPFHSPIMRPAMEAMRDLLDQPRGSSLSASTSDTSPSNSTPIPENNPSNSTPQHNNHEDIISFPGRMPCISNVTARPFASRHQLKDLLARQCVETVLWSDSIRYLDHEERVRRWIGIGPGLVGRNLVGKEVGMRQGVDGQPGRSPVRGGGVWGVCDPRDVEGIMKELDETERMGVD